ncbi:Catenin alpha-1, partial [Varanus komodoensis]
MEAVLPLVCRGDYVVEAGPQCNEVTFRDTDATQKTSPRGQDGEDLHGLHGLPLDAQLVGRKGDCAAEHQHAEGAKLAYVPIEFQSAAFRPALQPIKIILNLLSVLHGTKADPTCLLMPPLPDGRTDGRTDGGL